MLYEHSHTATLYSQFSGMALEAGLTGSLQNGTGGSPAPELLALYIRIEWLSLAGVCKNYTVPAAIRELNKLSISIGADGRYRQFYALSKKQKAILETCRITPSEYSAQIKRICAKLPARMI
jgi:hypothetical protein